MTGERDGARKGTGYVAPVVGIVLLSVTISLVVVGTVLLFGGGDFGRVVWGPPGGPGLWALGFSVAGYPITRRHPANPVGWCLMVAGAAAGVNLLGLGVAAEPSGLALLLVNAWVVSVGALGTALVLFPSGSPPSRWWWAQLGVLWGISFLEYFKEYETSAGFVGLPERLDVLATPVNIAFQVSLASAFFALLARWRRSGPVERLQLKWVVYSVALVATSALVVEVGLANLAPAWYLPGTVVQFLAVLAVPVTIGVAMLRYRLYDIDLSSTVLWCTVRSPHRSCACTSAVWSASSTSSGLCRGGSQLAVVASTLVIAALFNPLETPHPDDYRPALLPEEIRCGETLEAFSGKLRDETDLDTLTPTLVAVVRDDHAARARLAVVEAGRRPTGERSRKGGWMSARVRDRDDGGARA